MTPNKTYVIAEAGVNHNGSLEMAKELVDAAVAAEADAVKFQTFKTESIVSRFAGKADYQKETTGSQSSQFEMIKELELNEQNQKKLFDYCGEKGIQFLSTPYDLESVDFLTTELDLPTLKIASAEITNGPLLLRAAQSQKSIILSTGMCEPDEIETALGVLAFGYIKTNAVPSLEGFKKAYLSSEGKSALLDRVTLLQCTTEYPAPYEEIHLRVMETLHGLFGLPVGYSDHTVGLAISFAATALGASIIEKHYTLDRNLPGPDHRASLEPNELEDMIRGIREIEKAMGSPEKTCRPCEQKNKPVMRKSLIANEEIKKGDLLTDQNLITKRPGDGISPMQYWDYLGKSADKDYGPDEKIYSQGTE
jgi:N-acetylneuraminate synthase